MDLIPEVVVQAKKDLVADMGYFVFGRDKPRVTSTIRGAAVAVLDRRSMELCFFPAIIRTKSEKRAWIDVDYKGQDKDQFLLLGWEEV